ncbi:MAG: FlgD immunoglobulin-like domain containing protein, partial [Candidatus Krumholzibacteria bacterium]
LTAGDAVFINNAGQSFTVEALPTGFDSPPFGALSMRNFPNPFNPSTEIVFDMVRAGHASLVVFDAQGRLVTKLLDRDLEAGPNRVVWDGRNVSGRVMATGVYFYRLVTRDAVLTRKMVLLK